MKQFAWLWEDEEWADFRLDVLPAGKGPSLQPTGARAAFVLIATSRYHGGALILRAVSMTCADAGQDSPTLYSLHLNSVALAAASPGHFRVHCVRQRRELAKQSNAVASKASSAGGKRSASDMMV